MENTIPINERAINEVAIELRFAADNLYFLKNSLSDGSPDGMHMDHALYVPLRILETNIKILEALIKKGGAE